MNFQVIKTAIVSMLASGAAGRYRVIGYPQQAQSAQGTKDLDRSVQVFYASGSFPKSGAGMRGPVRHEMTFRVEMTASSAAKINLAAVEDPSSTPAQVAAAIAGVQDAAALADESADELFAIVYGVLMDNRDVEIIEDGPVASRWISDFQKDPPHPRGQFVSVTSALSFTCVYFEELDGAEALNLDGSTILPVTISVDISNDDVDAEAAVEVGPQ